MYSRNPGEKPKIGRDWPDPLPLCGRNISQSSFKPTDPSSGSMLLGRLPLEIRLQIYGCVLGNRRIIHLSPSVDRDRLANLMWKFAKVELALLRTCRQIYNGAVNIVYGANVIHMESQRILIDLADKYLRPQRLAAIRSLHIESMHCSFSRRSSTLLMGDSWPRFWGIIAQRMNLAELRLFIYIRSLGDPVDITTDAPWVKPILAVKGIKVLNLDIEAMPASYPRQPQYRSLVESLRKQLMAEH
ncbi:hypothetical protein MMC22_001612 [Lobaria immixta]|nr:hypothetical protein [Lobaria immixta]